MGKLPLGTSHIRYTYRVYRKNASKRGIPFALSMKEYRAIVVLNCHYCGSSPKVGYHQLTPVPLNGVDRVDPDLGYTPENCVPACSTCNKLKSNRPVEDFLQHIRRIYEHIESTFKKD